MDCTAVCPIAAELCTRAAELCTPMLQSFVLVLRSLVPMWPPCPASVPVLKSLVLISASLLVLQSCMLVLRSLIPVASAPYAEEHCTRWGALYLNFPPSRPLFLASQGLLVLRLVTTWRGWRDDSGCPVRRSVFTEGHRASARRISTHQCFISTVIRGEGDESNLNTI